MLVWMEAFQNSLENESGVDLSTRYRVEDSIPTIPPMKRVRFYAFLLTALSALTLHAVAQETAQQIFEEVEARQDRVRSEAVTIDMTIIDDRGRTRNRVMQTWSKTNDDGLTRSLIRFSEPADIRGLGLLTLETEDGDDQRLYLPALKRVQRIAGSSRQDRFAGSDFSYEDLGTYDPDQFETSLLETTDTAWILEAVTLDADSQYDKLELTVDQQRYVLLAVDYYDRSGTLVKTLRTDDFTELAPDIWRANQMTMINVRDDRRTELVFRDRDIASDIDDDLFTERQLKRGIR